MRIAIPDFSLVALIGASGSGKSTFAQKHFAETEVVSSDRCRALVADNETDQSATRDAFDLLYAIASKRLAARRLTVIDATNLRPEDRAKGIEVARRYHALPVAIVLDIPPQISAERNKSRPNRAFGAKVVFDHARLLRKSLRNLRREGYRSVFVLDTPEEVDGSTVVREPLYNDRRNDHGPFDIVGDIHGCYDELVALLRQLGYVETSENGRATWQHPQGRRAIFLGDIVDRGPGIVAVMRLVMNMVDAGTAVCVPGNHENKLARKLDGKNVTVSHGLAETLAQIDSLPDDEQARFKEDVRAFIESLISHYWLDDGKLIVAHAGLRQEMHGRGSREVRDFALYGETTGETDEFGLPVRYDWAKDYRGSAIVAYGHTPVPQVEWVNKTICLDTGCVYGGALTALRYPELQLLSVPALRTYVEPVRPLVLPETQPTAQQHADGVLDIEDVAGKRRIPTRYSAPVMIPAENAAAALEVISRYCVDPRWLIYLPPTMSPSETSSDEDLLEHPNEAFAYYRRAGVDRVMLEEKHMGSRAVAILARDEAAAGRRFGISSERGVLITRTGRRFFSREAVALGREVLMRIGVALDATDFWKRFETDWVCLDAEIMPWSAKAQELVDHQYAPVGEAALADLDAAERALEAASGRGIDTALILETTKARHLAALGYVQAFRRYVRPARSIADLQIAPFHLLATEGNVHVDQTHRWHMDELRLICAADPSLLLATEFREISLSDDTQVAEAISWWQDLTSKGGEGIVVKPQTFVARDTRGLVQPALKVRGREYLRIVYGPEYTIPENLQRLRERAVASKRRLALAEFALGLEGLHRFVERQPLRSIHECVFGVLALESEPVDPRL